MKTLAAVLLALLTSLPVRADLAAFDAAVRAACPQVDGVSADGTVWFQAGATCQASAQVVINNKTQYLNAVPVSVMQIVSNSTPSLNGYYAIDLATQQNVQAVSIYIAVNGRFPAGQSTLSWPDKQGALHQFQTTAQFIAFASGMADIVTALALGQTPAQPVTIP